MNKSDLVIALKKILLDDGGNKLSSRYSTMIGLSVYYGMDSIPQNIQAELDKLSHQLSTLQTLESLLKALEQGRSKRFEWNPISPNSQLPTNLAINPIINFDYPDDSRLIAHIEKIRGEINQQPVDTMLIISYISKMAKQAGDLNLK